MALRVSWAGQVRPCSEARLLREAGLLGFHLESEPSVDVLLRLRLLLVQPGARRQVDAHSLALRLRSGLLRLSLRLRLRLRLTLRGGQVHAYVSAERRWVRYDTKGQRLGVSVEADRSTSVAGLQPGGKLAFTGSSGRFNLVRPVQIWDLERGEVLDRFANDQSMFCGGMTPEGAVVIGGRAGRIIHWRPR